LSNWGTCGKIQSLTEPDETNAAYMMHIISLHGNTDKMVEMLKLKTWLFKEAFG